MKTIYYICFVLGLVGFVACSEDNGEFPDVPDGELCSLTIQLGAANNQETRVGGDDNALDGEFINSLWVFITNDNGVVEKKLTLDEGSTSTVDPTVTAGGNILEWRHTIEDLPVGDKFIYAFANMEAVSTVKENQNMSTLLSGISEGINLSTAVDGLVINNPASTVNIASGQYIPMSLKEKVTVTGDQTIRVELVRLVGRVDIQLTNDNLSEVKISNFTMGQFADQVALMPGGTVDNIKTYSTFESELTILAGESHEFQFYVNETKNGTPFSIQLTADDKKYSATTTAKAIPRNYILPLNLTLREGDLSLIVMAYIAPIGGYPVPIYTSEDLLNKNEFAVEVPEGCSFQAIAKVGENETPGVCEFSHPEGATNANIQIDKEDPSWAYVTALSDLSESLNVSVIGTGYTCKLKISTVPLKDWTDYPITRSLRQWQAEPTLYELVPLRMANPE